MILMIFGIYQVEGLNSLSFLIPAVAMAVKSAIFEELVYPGVLLQSVESTVGTWSGVIVSSLAFGLIHPINPDATIGGAI